MIIKIGVLLSQVGIIFDVTFVLTLTFKILFYNSKQHLSSSSPVDTRRRFNVYKTCIRRPRRRKTSYGRWNDVVCLLQVLKFVFSNLYVCEYFLKTFHSNQYCRIFQDLCPLQDLHLNDSLVSLLEKEWAIFTSSLRILLCSKINVGNHRLLYVLVEIGLLFF